MRGSIHLEWKGDRSQDAQRQRASPGDPPIGHAVRDASVTLRKPEGGPIFANFANKPASLVDMVNRRILPALNVCETCHKPETDHVGANHGYKRDAGLPEWCGWHAARRGLGSNLYRMGIPEMVIQRILRHSNVSTTATYYIKTAAGDVRGAMEKLKNHIAEAGEAQRDTNGTLDSLQAITSPTIQ